MVRHGNLVYCCANCSQAVEQQGPGSDPEAGRYESTTKCGYCGTPITDESTLTASGGDPYCCDNCALMAA
jgi:hypothetical protein